MRHPDGVAVHGGDKLALGAHEFHRAVAGVRKGAHGKGHGHAVFKFQAGRLMVDNVVVAVEDTFSVGTGLQRPFSCGVALIRTERMKCRRPRDTGAVVKIQGRRIERAGAAVRAAVHAARRTAGRGVSSRK